MELLPLLPSCAASARPLLATSRPSALRRAGTARPAAAASSSNVEVIETTATAASTSGGAARQQQWGAGGLGLELTEELRRGMVWRMLAPPAAAVAADAAFLRLLDGAAPGYAPAWATAAGSALLFAAGLLGVHYGFLSSRWDAAERGSVLGWDLAVRHWSVMSVAKEYSSSANEDEDDDDDEEYEDDEDYEEEDEADDD